MIVESVRTGMHVDDGIVARIVDEAVGGNQDKHVWSKAMSVASGALVVEESVVQHRRVNASVHLRRAHETSDLLVVDPNAFVLFVEQAPVLQPVRVDLLFADRRCQLAHDDDGQRQARVDHEPSAVFRESIDNHLSTERY